MMSIYDYFHFAPEARAIPSIKNAFHELNADKDYVIVTPITAKIRLPPVPAGSEVHRSLFLSIVRVQIIENRRVENDEI